MLVYRGREELAPSPPSEPCERFSRTRLSGRWFPHRDWHATAWASCKVKSPCSAKKAFGQHRWVWWLLPQPFFRLYHWPPFTPFSRAANMRSVHTDASTQSHDRVSAPRLVVANTVFAIAFNGICMSFSHPSSYPPSLSVTLLSTPFTTRSRR